MRHLWLRTDASPEIGLGHLVRCSAVAEVARSRGVATTFVVEGQVAVAFTGRMGFATRPPSSDWRAEVTGDDAVVLDGYGFGPEAQGAAAATGAVVAAIDDFGHGTFTVDLLVNPNPVQRPTYVTPPGALVLVGPRYSLLREAFRHAGPGPIDDEPDHLVLTFGGADPANLLERVLPLLDRRTHFRRVTAVVGPAAAVPDVRGHDVAVVRDPPDLVDVFAGADAAVAAAGGTTWELLCLGVPTALVQVVDNQEEVLEAARSHGAALVVGGPDDLTTRLLPTLEQLADPAVRRQLRAAGQALVDGRGAERVVDALESLSAARTTTT